MKHVLVTGGAGFIGASLVRKLLENGDKVVVIDNLITSNGESIKPLLKNPNFKFIKRDIIKPLPSSIINHQSSIGHIFHLACPTGVPNLTKLAREMLLTSAIGTMNVLELARKHKAKFIFTSSSEVYGDPKVFPQNENYTGNVSSVGIRSPYEEGKRFAESLIMTYVRKYNLDARIVRVFNTYGPLMSINDTRVIPKFLKQISKNQPLTVQGDGRQTRTFCYVDDLIKGLVLLMDKGGEGEVYNLGSNKEISINTLAGLMIKITKSKSKTINISRPSHDHNRRLPDLRKANKLNWYTKVGLDEGLERTVRWFGF
ncbi:MAG: hypothetical protein A3B44_00330 [Candidatus Levybacteria bacterium RIFCSPLOWO2_01_FULL_38_21]|nr:MAG: hypothetical protein A3B44_00330 [Candidatus Levybacteria bacterium RIFCSPLOWO2_01_FULL_38_21]